MTKLLGNILAIVLWPLRAAARIFVGAASTVLDTWDSWDARANARKALKAREAERAREAQRRCASGAHFRGNCQCIGVRGLRHRDTDRSYGIDRPWDWYYLHYGEDDPDTAP